jgi:hypothetical protein
MPSILHDGLRYIQTQHRIQCKTCSDIILSRHNHDFKYCSCNSVGIDGGIGACNRILGKPDDYINLGVYAAKRDGKNVYLDPAVVDSMFRQKMD